ncbi:MAG: hypothetical protein PUB93_08190 [Firmicutes bacterium]|nr:hypothetical protein [Bacillota bacterium]
MNIGIIPPIIGHMPVFLQNNYTAHFPGAQPFFFRFFRFSPEEPKALAFPSQNRAEKRPILRAAARLLPEANGIFVDSDEKSLKIPENPLAFCAKFLYNDT